MVRTPNRTGRKPARRSPPPRRPAARGASTSTPAPALRTWVIVGVTVIGLLLAWRIASLLFAGGGSDLPSGSGASGATGIVAGGEAPPAPQGSRSAAFPAPVVGTRLELRLIALGDHPDRCTAESVEIGGDVRTVYHHRCEDEPDVDRYYFLVELTNLTGRRVTAELGGFSVEPASGQARPALGSPPPDANPARFFPPSQGIVADGKLKRWVTIDGTDGFVPSELTYRDGAESLTVRIPDAWI